MSIADVGLTANCRALVTITLEIPISSNWGGTTEVNQIVGQARDQAVQKVYDLTRNGAKIIGKPVVTMVMTEASDRV